LEDIIDVWDWNNRGYAFKQLGDFDQALYCYRKSISCHRSTKEEEHFVMVTPGVDKQHPSNAMGLANAYANMGSLLIQMGRLDEAKGAFNEALKIIPDDGLVYFRLGEIALLFERDDRKGLELLRKAVECEPGNSDILMKYVRWCYKLRKQEDFEKGLATFLKRKRTDVPFLIATGYFLGEELDPDVAIRCFDAALKAAPNSASAWFNKGVSLHRKDRRHRAGCRPAADRRLVRPDGPRGRGAALRSRQSECAHPRHRHVSGRSLICLACNIARSTLAKSDQGE
jgi:tetratricopeptide (TPR) repeat protein